MTTEALYVGIDVSKAHLDVAVSTTGELWRTSNDEAGIKRLEQNLASRDPALVVMEATGGYEMPLASALGAAGIPIAIVNPRQIRDFAKAIGKLAKTDVLNAQVLALFAQRPAHSSPPGREPGTGDGRLGGAATATAGDAGG